ncbi:MAG: radical SAM family heme chaperone HemW [Roseburia sp.]
MGARELELYIHIPFCVKKCEYCDFLSFPADESAQKSYVQALLREIAYYGEKCSAYTVTSIYVGGGTPSWLDEALMAQILKEVSASFLVSPQAEVSIECNPGTVTNRKFAVYRQIGINRISIGLQSADEKELQLLGRIHTFEQFLKTYGMARQNGFDNINVDIMSGLPGQTEQSLQKTLSVVLRLKPEHICVYSLIIEEGTPFYDKYKFDAIRQAAGMQTTELPQEEEICRMLSLTGQMLGALGYEQYEISNFAKKGYACRHNIGYWQRKDYLGLGIGAASLMDNIRYANLRDFYVYLEESKAIKENVRQDEQSGCELPATNLHAFAEKLSRKAQMEEFMFLGLRMTEGIRRDDFEQAFGLPIEGVYQEPIRQLLEEGLLLKKEGRIFLTKKGQDISNYALSKFLLT